MKVFLSWSGSYSREIANLFAEWIPAVLQSVEIFISTKDIGAGERWGTKISGALEEIEFGLIFVTEQNRTAPWLLFEAGALAKNVQTSKVVPVLCHTSNDLEFKKNPLSHFQCVSLDKTGIFSALKSIFDSSSDAKITEAAFEKALETWWPQLESNLAQIEVPKTNKKNEKSDPNDRIENLERAISELIGTVRSQNDSLRRVGKLPGVPPSYRYKSILNADKPSSLFVRNFGEHTLSDEMISSITTLMEDPAFRERFIKKLTSTKFHQEVSDAVTREAKEEKK